VTIAATTGTNCGYLQFENNTTWLIGGESSTGGGLLSGSSPYALAIGSESGTYPIQFGINNRILASILANGNVGIGTTSPASLLHLLSSNDTQATIESTGNASVLSFRKGGTDQWYILQERDTPAYGMSSNDLGFIATSHPTQPALMIQRSTQYVGIGTIPSYPLDVNGEINCTSFQLTLPSNATVQMYTGAGVAIMSLGTGLEIQTTGSGGLSISTGGVYMYGVCYLESGCNLQYNSVPVYATNAAAVAALGTGVVYALTGTYALYVTH
jgi:hypothetical protein